MRTLLLAALGAIAFASLVTHPSSVFAANEETVLLRTPYVTMTKADYDAELSRLPQDRRDGFSASAKRVTDLLNMLLVNHTLAAQAVRNGLDKERDVQQQIQSETTRILARRQLAAIEEQAGREFDAKGDLTAAARERYIVAPEKYRQSAEVSASHILFVADKRTDAAARVLSQETRAKLKAGADFDRLASELSEDPSAKQNGGRLGFFPAEGKMDPSFAKAAFALSKVGDISEPVKSRFGWHIIRLDARRDAGQRPFDEVKLQIITEMRQRHIGEARDAALAAIRNDPAIVVNQPALDALTVTPPVPVPTQGSAGSASTPSK